MSIFDDIEQSEFPVNEDGAMIMKENDHKVHFLTGCDIEMNVETEGAHGSNSDYTCVDFKGMETMSITFFDPVLRREVTREVNDLKIETWGTWELKALINIFGYGYKMLKKQNEEKIMSE